MFRGSLINRLARSVASLVLVVAIGHLTAARVEAQQSPPTHQAILDSVGAVQTTVNSIETKVDNIKAKLDLIPPAWSQTLGADRFQLVMGGAAVLDKETGLVWERSPEPFPFSTEWLGAQPTCNIKTVAGRLGWRLPTIQELASLIDPTIFPGPTLPPGHPFINVQSDFYWSATSSAGSACCAFGVFFQEEGGVGYGDKLFTGNIWCVRGGQGIDPQ